MSDDVILQVQELIESANASLKTAHALLRQVTGVTDTDRERIVSRASSMSGSTSPVSGKVVEGIFDGQNMVDASGQTYPVPANYASKSKLVEGDGMKLTITDEGKFIYKQIAPVKRRTAVGVLIQEDGQYKILAEGKAYRLLLASVTFYRAEVGDQVTILLPEDMEAKWGAVENVLPKHIAQAAARADVAAESTEDGELSPRVEK
ncbi:hypothetical protein A3C37_01905 [Candidatus Peribacteria bacterium RIFCSPHIGHO2_02_FULL_53_20]|nr:MAG: hypothetical protein A3C37_01905 [Candidatus Peribacteria bacterium RIFCSPHIGHO2_02_FULL_53_20]OGJ73244.1 MAG: hypothetical protein A3G69_05715 [Candidatus Peribacteria bacterium RIFCSPLOWO2_12_FULL_53_10]